MPSQTALIDPNIFNTEKTDYNVPNLLLGQPMGLFDTVHNHHPELLKLFKGLRRQDWDENEFDYKSCNAEFKSCSKSSYQMMIINLAFQWEADTVASKTLGPIMAPFITDSSLKRAWDKVVENEDLHAATYSEIVRFSFDDSSKVLTEILAIKESFARLATVCEIMATVYKVSHEYALGLRENNQETYNYAFLFCVVMYLMERIQFMSSFAVTFLMADSGQFMPIGKGVQKIASDEIEYHVEIMMYVIRNELRTPRGKAAWEWAKSIIQKAADEILARELFNCEFLFSEGRELVGANEAKLKDWCRYVASGPYQFLGLEAPETFPERNPFKFLEKGWLNMGKFQPSPQEEQNGQYKVNAVRRNDENMVFDADF